MNPYENASEVITDEQLMEKYKKGDYMAFEALYYRHEQTIYSYLSRRLRDIESINEVFQNTFLKFHKSKHQYDNKYAFLKWLYTISRSELYDFCKKKRIETIPIDETILNIQQTSHENTLNLDDVKSLTATEKKAIELRFYSEQDYLDISKSLNITQANARKIVSRGIKKLKEKLSGAPNG